MRILLTNDDGIQSRGIWALAVELSKQHSVVISAPLHQQSGMSHALSVLRNVEFIKLNEKQISSLINNFYPNTKLENNIEAWSIDGTPTDCTKIYLEALCQHKPDLLLSGINLGSNLATDVLYSGTVGAAMEGFLHEISSFAISLDIHSSISFEQVALIMSNFINLQKNSPLLFNINFPKKFKDDIPIFKFARLGKRDYINAFQKLTDECGRTFFKIGGQIYDIERGEGTDIFSVDEGFISVTPLHLDLTNFLALKEFSNV